MINSQLEDIFVSFDSKLNLKFAKKVDIRLSEHKIRNFEINSQLNFFPDLRICKKLILKPINNQFFQKH